MNAHDAKVVNQTIEAARRQAELEGRHRDLTKEIPPLGTNGASIRSHKSFEGISDAILEERAKFNLRDHMLGVKAQESKTLNLGSMTPEELQGLAQAAAQELESRKGD